MASKAAQPQVEKVVKPYLRGVFCGKDAWKEVPKRFVSMLAVCFIYLIASMLTSFDSLALRCAFSAVIVAIVLYYEFARGMGQGTGDTGYGEMMYVRQEEGKTVSEDDRARCFHPLKGFFEAFLGALPFFLVALVFALITRPTTYSLGALPSWTEELMLQNEFGDALRYYEAERSVEAMDILRVVARIMAMPLMSVATCLGNDATLLAERLVPLFVLLAPAAYGAGYTRGPVQRTLINTGIQIGVNKKRRKQSKERKARRKQNQSKTPERLI